MLATLSVIDWRTYRLPDALTLPLIAGGLVVTAIEDSSALPAHALAAIFGGASIWAISELYLRVRKHAGIGLGDAKLLAAAGAWLGPFILAPTLLVSALLAIAYIFLLRLGDRPVSLTDRVAFGPFLSVSFFIFWLFRFPG